MSSNRYDDPTRHGQSYPWIRCAECGKRGYESRKIAKRAARAHHGHHLGQYRCDSGLWHLGHLAQAVMHGTATRAEVYGRAAAA